MQIQGRIHYIISKLYCNKIGHNRVLIGLCLNKSCLDKRFICEQCINEAHHRQHKNDCISFNHLIDFINFYNTPDQLIQNMKHIFHDYKQRIITNLNDIEEMITKIMKQRDIGTLNQNFLSQENRTLLEIDSYANQLSKLVKFNNSRLERDSQFLQDLEYQIQQHYQLLIKEQLDCLQQLVSKYSQFTLIQQENNKLFEKPRNQYGLDIISFERFLFSNRYLSPRVRIKDEFIVKGVGTAILEPSLDHIFYNEIQVRIWINEGLQASIGVCTLNDSNISLMDKMFLIQSDGYMINTNNSNQHYQNRSFQFGYGDIIHLKYNKQLKSIIFTNEKTLQCVTLSKVEDKNDLFFCISLTNCEVTILNI